MKKCIGLILLILLFHSCKQEKSGSCIPGRTPYTEALQERILKGWNTWNNPHLMSHVVMPDGLALNLKFRQAVEWSPHFLDESYISNPIHGRPEQIIPGEHAYDGSYTDLTFEWVGLNARVQSATDGDDIVILFTPYKQAQKPHIMILETAVLWNKSGYVEKNGNNIVAHLKDKRFRVRSTRKDENFPLPLAVPYFSMTSDRETGFYTGSERSLEEIREIIEVRRHQQLARKEKYRELSEAYHIIQVLHAWNTIYDAFNHRAITPVSRSWNENWGGYVLFDWDTYFTAVMLAVDNKDLAYSNAIAITNAITEEGFIPNFEGPFNRKSFDRSQPPVGSIIARLIYEKYGEKPFLEELYDELLTWNRWWMQNRENQGYLSWGSSPFADKKNIVLNRDKKFNKQAAKYESGLDNSPLFDDAVYNDDLYVLDLASVGLMGLYVADCRDLAFIAEELGKTKDASELRERGQKYAGKLQELWVEEKGIFMDKYLDRNEFSTHLAPTNFYPLIGKVPTQEQAEEMIEKHFLNPDEFYGEWMIPSIARNDPAFSDQAYWRGRIWAPMNFLVYLGLRNYDLPEARKILVEKSLNLIMKGWNEEKRVYENYNTLLGTGKDIRSSDGFYSWGGLLALIPLMENGYYE